MTSGNKSLLLASLVFIFLLAVGGWGIKAYRQDSLIILQASEVTLESSDPVSAIFTSPSDDQVIHLVNGLTGQVTAYRQESDTSFRPSITTYGSLAVGPHDQSAYLDRDFRINISSLTGKPLAKFSSYPVFSLAFLSNGDIVVASPLKKHLIHVYSSTGRLLRSFGTVKKHYDANDAQNQFLNRGKVLVDAKDNIYYVYQYAPLIQRYSSSGELIFETDVQGEAINLQSTLAHRYLTNKDPNEIGGIHIINSATIDYKTGHLWICMNGSSATAVVQEYDTEGKKVREYGLEHGAGRVTGPKDIAITSSMLHILTTQHEIYSFNRVDNPTPRIERLNLKTRGGRVAVGPAVRSSLIVGSALQSCGTAQTWGACSYICPGPACNGSTPTATSSDGTTKDCRASLQATIGGTYTVVTANCTQYAPGTAMHMRGGCTNTVRVCSGTPPTNTDHTITIDCSAPTCSGGGGGDSSDYCGAGNWCNPTYSELQGCNGSWSCSSCECLWGSPILIDVQGDGFALTDAANGVNFDLNGRGVPNRWAWTAAGSDEAFLFLDRNGNGRVDNGTELFGNFTLQPPATAEEAKNGFRALAEYDKVGNGGNNDDAIDSRDAIFTSLRLWRDVNHNGISEPGELHTLPALGLVWMDLDYKESKRQDQHGNQFKYRAKVKDAQGAQLGRWAWDVFFIRQP